MHSKFQQTAWTRWLWLVVTLLTGSAGAHAAEVKTAVFFGDSLTAGYGVEPEEAYPALIQHKIDAAKLPWRVVNAGLSGDTTSGGLRRIDWILRQKVDLVVVELGGNDGLRGIAPTLTRINLSAIIDRIRQRYPDAKLVVAGMQLPTNLGPDYTREFAAIFPEVAERGHAVLIPFLLDHVGGIPSLNQADGIHPTAEGHRIVAETVWRTLQPPALNRLRGLGASVAFAASLALVSAQETGPLAWLDRLHLTASGTASWVENASRTSFEPTRIDAATYEFTLAGSVPRQLAPSVLLLGSGEVGSLTVADFRRADHIAANGRLTLQKKIGLGPQAWALQASAGGGYKAARFSGDRGWTTEAGIQVAKRVWPNLRTAAFARWSEQDAKSAVFDLNQHSFGLEAQWDIDDRWTLSGSASRLTGDIVANAAWPVWQSALNGGLGARIQQYYTSRPWTETAIWGPRWVSYNVEADVDLWSVALSYAWTDHTALELSRNAAYVVNRAGVAYPSSTWGLSVRHRF